MTSDLLPTENDTWLTTKQAAELLSVHQNTLLRWRFQGKGPACVRLVDPTGRNRVSKRYRFLRSAIYAWLADKIEAVPQPAILPAPPPVIADVDRMTSSQACAYLGMTPKALQRAYNKRELAHFKTYTRVGKTRVFFRKVDLDAYVARRDGRPLAQWISALPHFDPPPKPGLIPRFDPPPKSLNLTTSRATSPGQPR